MRCLYCGKELALFKRLRGGEFCSDAHRQRYQEEYTQLALNRLLQANSPQRKNAAQPGGPIKEIGTAEPESPALKRRERMGREESPAALPALSTPLALFPRASPNFGRIGWPRRLATQTDERPSKLRFSIPSPR